MLAGRRTNRGFLRAVGDLHFGLKRYFDAHINYEIILVPGAPKSSELLLDSGSDVHAAGFSFERLNL